jgi:hypothetical protein
MMTRIPFETLMRAAAVQTLTDFAQDANLTLQVYPGRPLTLNPPAAFVERIRETITGTVPWGAIRERHVFVDIRIVWGRMDSADAVAQRDFFVDNFVDWVWDRPHSADGQTIIEPREVDDDPNFVAEWMPPERQRDLFASTVTLEGVAGGP